MTMKSTRKLWISFVVVVVTGLAAAGIWRYREAAAEKAKPKYETTRVTRGKIVARVTATGTVSALVTVQVGSQVSGRIQQINVDYNTPVKKGQVIARIDPQLFTAAVEQARANHMAAKGNLAKAKVQALDARRQFDRYKTLRGENLIAQAELDTAEANAQVAEAQIAAAEGAMEMARAALHQAEVNLDYTTIHSPTNGVVISRSVDVGQTVAASLQSPTLFTIAEDLQKMQVDTNVAESDVGKLKPQMAASFTVDAYPNERFAGVVRQIRNAPQTVQNVVTYDAVIDVDNSSLKLKPGMTATVTFIYADKEDVLRVPSAALRFRPPTDAVPGAARTKKSTEPTTPDHRTVWVLRGVAPEPVSVRVGVSDGSLSEIIEGEIHEGDPLVTEMTGGKSKPPPSFGRTL